METVILVTRVFLAAVFAVAAIAKVLDVPGTKQAARDFGATHSLALPIAIGLPAVELLIAAGLLVQPTGQIAALAALVLLVAFTVAIARLMRQGVTVDCHCFGQLQSSKTGPSTLARNAVLGAVAALAAIEGPGASIASLAVQELALLATTLSTIGLAVFALGQWRENLGFRARIDIRERADQGLPKGTAVPDLELKDVLGDPVSLAASARGGKPTLLVQIGIGCRPCHQMMPDLVRWSSALSDSLNVLVVSSGADVASNKLLSEQIGLPALLVDERRAFPAEFDVRPTPSAVLIDRRGRIAAPPALGAPAIEALARSVLGEGDRLLRSAAA